MSEEVRRREQGEELARLMEEAQEAAYMLLREVNARQITLVSLPPSKRIFLFFLTKALKTFSAVRQLCAKGYEQDVCLLLRSLLETLISVRYILHTGDPDGKAVRFVEYKWIMFKRALSDAREESSDDRAGTSDRLKELVERKCQEFKKKYAIISDKALVTWSGRSIRDMAKLADKALLREYNDAFRFFSRFSHPNIIGDNEYMRFQGDSVVFLPAARGGDFSVHVGMSVKYLAELLSTCCHLFNLSSCERIDALKGRCEELWERVIRDDAGSQSVDKQGVKKESLKGVRVNFEVPEDISDAPR
jgi:hypothetical protein